MPKKGAEKTKSPKKAAKKAVPKKIAAENSTRQLHYEAVDGMRKASL